MYVRNGKKMQSKCYCTNVGGGLSVLYASSGGTHVFVLLVVDFVAVGYGGFQVSDGHLIIPLNIERQPL